MYCTRKVLDDLIWVGANDRRLVCFEGAYDVPNGVSYNSYLMLDEKTVLFDTVDKAVFGQFFENIDHALGAKEVRVHRRKCDAALLPRGEPACGARRPRRRHSGGHQGVRERTRG